MWGMVGKLRDEFPLIRVVTTRGNHGRTGKDVSPEANWDNMLFQQLELLIDLEDDPDLIIKNRYGDYNTFQVKGWRGMVRHKAPVQADTSAAQAKFAGWQGIHQWDIFMYGHFHHWGVMTWNSKPIIRNGSLMGGDDYAETLAAYDDPTQVVFTVNKKHLPAAIYPVKF